MCVPQLFNQEFNYFLEKNSTFVAEPQSLFKIYSSKPGNTFRFSSGTNPNICRHRFCASAKQLSLGPYEAGAQKQQSCPGGAPVPSSQAWTSRQRVCPGRGKGAAGGRDAW